MALRIARRLPGDRGPAFLDLLRAGRGVATGRMSRPALRTVDSPAAARARAHLREGRAEAAIAEADRALQAAPFDPGCLDVRRLALVRSGELTAALGTLRRLRSVADTPILARDERALRGRLAELTPGWLPRIPGAPARVDAVPGRVLHLLKESLPAVQSGYTLRSRYTLLSQRAAGLEPIVVTELGFPRSAGVTEVEPLELVDGIPHHRLDLGPDEPADAPLDEVLRRQAWLVARLARELRPEILHAGSGRRGYESALVALAVGRALGIPVVYEVRSFLEATWATGGADGADGAAAGPGGAADDAGHRSELTGLRSATELRAMLGASAVITIAEAMRDEIVDRGVPADRVHVIPNGVDPAAFQPGPRDAGLAARYGLGDRPVIGYVSTLDHPREGHEVLIEAVAALARRHRPVHALIVGDGGRRATLEALSRRLGVRDSVIFTGRVDHAEVAAHHGLIDLFVVPRRDDRAARYVTPLKPFEAMAMARPLVVADLPALLELADPDGPRPRGVAFRTGSAESLAEVIVGLIDDPDRAAALGRAGREWVATERTWAANGPRYRRIYEAVLEGPR